MGTALTVQPLLDYLFVRILEPRNAVGLIVRLPGTDPTAPIHAEVLAVGPGRPSEYIGQTIQYAQHTGAPARPVPVSVGDTILMAGGAGMKFTCDGEEIRAILPRDLVGVVSAA